MKKYLIGKMSLAEQMKNKLSVNHSGLVFTKTEIRKQVGREYAYGFNSVRDFEFGAIVIDKLFEIDQSVAENILLGRTDIFYYHLVSMSGFSTNQLKDIANSVSGSGFDLKQLIKSINAKPISNLKFSASVKSAPGYDPDAEISSLALTIPSWISSIEKAHKAITCQISEAAAENCLISFVN